MFKSVDSQPDFPKLEGKILRFWKEEKILPQYLSRNKNSKERFSFLDGPITANNPMGVHHAWGRTLKDLYQRYKNMRGFQERFQNGFDNQGLWVEVGVEKKLGFKTKKDIEKFGIDKFVEKCKEHTLHFAEIQTKQSQRLGYFMDWGNDYYTMSDENNYAIWHFLKKVWQDGNLYKGRDSVPWCPRCGTAISQHEILTEEYQELTHDSVFLKFPIVKRPGLANPQGQALQTASPSSFLVWTTTPWTLPANVALAVNPEVDYVVAKLTSPDEGRASSATTQLILAKSRLSVLKEPYEIIKEFKGSELVGLKYEGPFDDLPAVQKAQKEKPETFHTVVSSKDLVSEEEGTGIVHIATGCGTEDFRLGQEKNLPLLPAIDESANYLEGYEDLTGKNAKDDPSLVLGHPLLKNYIFDIRSFTHRYPVCWRCKTELVWRVVDEWYIAMDDARHRGAKNYRQRLREVIKDVRWIPSFGYERELDWLRNMEDWLISKKRYWGLALPIWECPKCGHFEVIGSKEELQQKAIAGWEDFGGHTPHRPWVDKVKIRCAECSQPMSRIPDVGNPWLDAGIVSFSTLKYFADKNYWQKWFPADLVLEGFAGQFKNWFYSLLTMSVVLEDAAPFKNLLGHALVKDEKGEEMHKSKGNAIWFDDAVEKMGADVMRWLYARQNPAVDLRFGYHPVEGIKRRFFFILWNCYKFFADYANIDGWESVAAEFYSAPDERQHKVLRLHILDRWVLSRLNNLIKTVTAGLDNFDNTTAARALEDFVVNDFSTWYIRRSRDRIGPTAPDGGDKFNCCQILYQVLLTLTKLLAPFTPFLAEEIYKGLAFSERPGLAKSVHLTDWPEIESKWIDEDLERKIALVREIVEKGHAARKEAGIKVRQPLASLKISNSKSQIPNKEELIQLIKDELNVREVKFTEGCGEIQVKLDTTLTPELRAEGEARELIRQIQNLRKKSGCQLDEKIIVEAPAWPENFTDYIKQKTLATELKVGPMLKVDIS
jgi:isoleucyl-tRNA synthetase